MSDKIVRIGCWSAFWGDTSTAAAQLLHRGGPLDYMVGDYLAELTLCILARIKSKKPQAGFVPDFLFDVWKPLMKSIIEKNVKIITNAGGMNPLGLKAAMEKLALEAGLQVKIAAVVGDDCTVQANKYRQKGDIQPFAIEGIAENLWSQDEKVGKDGKPVNSVLSCNIYFGAAPIVKALENGAQIVITGRCVDSALVLAPLMYEFGWRSDQYDLMSAGSLAGHIIECGAQCTGGNFTDWRDSSRKGWHDVGFPIVDCKSDGSFVVRKPTGTGGLVSVGTVCEQIVYEIGNPRAYALPDVFCDWTQVCVSQLSEDHVHVTNAKGRAPSLHYKIGVTAEQGFKVAGALLVTGLDAEGKAKALAKGLLAKCRAVFKIKKWGDFSDTRVEIIGTETTYGPNASVAAHASRECMLRIAATHNNRNALNFFGKEFAPCATGTAPGITGDGSGGGRASAKPCIFYYSGLIDKKKSVPYVLLKPVTAAFFSTVDFATVSDFVPVQVHLPLHPSTLQLVDQSMQSNDIYRNNISQSVSTNDSVEVFLICLCFGRSGDKGDSVNIGLIARHPDFYTFLCQHITTSVVQDRIRHLMKSDGHVYRYELPGIHAINFVATKALGNGGMSSLHLDNQGKTYAQNLLSLRVRVPKHFLALTYSDLDRGRVTEYRNAGDYMQSLSSQFNILNAKL